MAFSSLARTLETPTPMPAPRGELPILYEDDKEGDLGEVNRHVLSDETLHICLMAHFASKPKLRVYSNMNLYYDPGLTPLPYVSPDLMVVKPRRTLDEDVRSYHIGIDGPAPMLTGEVLSERSYEQSDLDEKITLYARLGIPEHILIDVPGEMLPERLLLKRLCEDGTYADEQDADGGVTSRYGFRLVLGQGGRLQVVNSKTRKAYVPPHEAQARVESAEVEARRARDALRRAEARIRQLEAALAARRKKRRKPKT